jgi:hypothetical protein
MIVSVNKKDFRFWKKYSPDTGIASNTAQFSSTFYAPILVTMSILEQ